MRNPDVLILGAGTAGCVAAAHLVREGAGRVLLVEAGSDDEEKLARLARVGCIPEEHDWQLAGRPGPGCQPLRLPRGKAVGGTSLIQGGVALRSSARDYDAWAQVAGDSWSFPRVLPLLRELETDADFGGRWHGGTGPLHIQRPRRHQWQPVHEAFVEGCRELGAPWCEDLNHPEATGVGPIPLAQREGTRQDVRRCFLEPVRHRPELSLRADTLGLRLLLDGRRAVGAEVAGNDGRVERIYAGQVAVCAGALHSPALLLRSGIGPPEQLAAAGVPVSVELPGVGRGLRDHPTLLLGLSQERGHGAASPFWFQVMLRHLGGTIRDLPDCALEVHHDFLLGPGTAAYRRSRLVVSLLAARGTGAVELASADPGDPPGVLLGYGDPADLEDLARGLAFALDLTETPAFARLGPRNARLFSPAGSRPGAPEGPLHLHRREVERRAQALAGYTTTAHHFHGSCAMGPAAAREAVVDEGFRVHGTENLRVGDVSVIPIPFRANTHLAAILIGERLGRRIVEDADSS